MKFLETALKWKAILDLFRKNGSASEDAEKKSKRWGVILTVALSLVVLVVGAALLIRKLKQRRLEKEAKQALEDYYSTEFDADEYADEDEENEEV
jgi:hypothetical protein